MSGNNSMAHALTEICRRGKYYCVPSLDVQGNSVIVNGELLRVARIYGEEFIETGVENPREYINKLQNAHSQGFKSDIFTFSQRPPDTHVKYPYRMEWESLAVIKLTTFAEWWDTLPQETRKNYRRALKRGVVVKEQLLDDALIHDIMALNNSSAIRQGREFDHYGKTFEQVKKDQISFPGRSDYICAYCDEELVGFVKFVRCGKIARLLQIIPKESAFDKRPGTALITKTVEYAISLGMDYLIYDRYVYGNKRTSSLMEFKRRHGFSEMLVPRYFVPLTVRGRIGVALRLYRNLGEMLPNCVLKIVLDLREKWYKFKLQRAGVAQG